MEGASTPTNVFTELQKVGERARDRKYRFFSLVHLLTVDLLRRSSDGLRKRAAAGLDGVSVEEYRVGLQEKLEDLHKRLREGRYRHQPIRRVHIPKEGGKTRPLGISTVEDKVVQGALKQLLEAVYEPMFLDCSYGFRPGRGAHDALRHLNQLCWEGEVNWILEADIVSFFDSLDRKKLMEMLQTRVQDGRLQRLVGKCLHVGVLEGEEFSDPETGTAQGSILSPLLGNIYLHHVLDEWFAEMVLPRMRGKAHLIRYADDFVMTFANREDALRVYAALDKRMARFGLKLHPEKTRLIDFRRPHSGPPASGPAPQTFDFLGFTVHWRKSRKPGLWRPGMTTIGRRLSRAIRRNYEWCREHRHLSVKEQHQALRQRLQGYYAYFGVNGNVPSLVTLLHHTTRGWFKWLTRRSQRTRLNWERFGDLLRDFPLPRPRVLVRLWSS